MDEQLYEEVCVGIGKVEANGKQQGVVSVCFPKQNPPFPDDPNHDENFDDRFLTLAAAKTLLIDLRNAIEDVVAGRFPESGE